jgi:phage repressor protein C with HTH and peptisase S24 domain
MTAAGVSQSELARRTGLSASMIGKLARGEARQSAHIFELSRALGVAPEYLNGESDLATLPDGHAARSVVLDVVPIDPDQVEIDMIDLAFGMGGTFIDTDHVNIEKVGFSRKWLRQFTQAAPSQLFTTKGIGDSMQPTISDHDIVVVDRSERRPEFGDKIWAIVFGGVGMIKRLRPMPDGSVQISSDNQLVRDAHAFDGELHIIGRVVAIVRKV